MKVTTDHSIMFSSICLTVYGLVLFCIIWPCLQRRLAIPVDGWQGPAWTVLHPSWRIWDRGKIYLFPFLRVLAIQGWNIFREGVLPPGPPQDCPASTSTRSQISKNVPKHPNIQSAKSSTVSSEIIFTAISSSLGENGLQMILQGICSWKGNHRTGHIVRLQCKEQLWALLCFCQPKIITNPFWPPLCDNLVNKQTSIIMLTFSFNSKAYDISVTSAKAWGVILEFSDS